MNSVLYNRPYIAVAGRQLTYINDPALDKVTQHITGTNGRKLVRVTYNNEFAAV